LRGILKIKFENKLALKPNRRIFWKNNS